jgi:excinuclease ABC subunit C
LDDVPGLGETRRKALMKQFGSLKRLRAATVEELTAVPGIGRRTAEAVLAAVAEPGAPSADPDPDVEGAGPDDEALRSAGQQGPVQGAAAGEMAEIGRVRPAAGAGA